ncbi:MAG: hypothetical protein ACLPIG_09025, partial [Methylocella sp.]
DDDLPVEMAALEKISNAQHSGSLPQKASFGEYAWLLSFAPEPSLAGAQQSRHPAFRRPVPNLDLCH